MSKRILAARAGAASLAALSLLGAACRPTPLGHRGGNTLFGPITSPSTTEPSAGSQEGDAVSLDASAVLADPGELEVQLADGPATAKRVTAIKRGADNFTWIGRTDDSAGPNVFVTVVNGQVAVHLQKGNEVVAGHTTGQGKGVRTRVPDGGGMSEDNEPGGGVPVPEGAGPAPAADTPVGAAATGNTTVDVLVVFNSAVANRYGKASVPALVQNAMDRLNKALSDSQTNMQVRLVHVEQVADAEIAVSGVSGNLPNVMRSRKVAQMRDQYGADLVQAWGTYPTVCGQGYQNSGNMPASYGFSIINAANPQCAYGVAPAHEIGHNLGGGHDRQTDRAVGRPGDAFGYVDSKHGFITIMSYLSSCRTCTYAWLFSNPNITYKGFPAGKAGSEDNARNIRTKGPAEANYRPTKV